MRIEDISIFGEYKQPENRVTSAFLQICKIGGENLIKFLCSEIEIHTQVKESQSIPDGLLQSDFSFRLLVESKIKSNSINGKQLENYHFRKEL